MKKSLSLIMVLSLLINLSVGGQVYQTDQLLALENRTLSSSLFKGSLDFEEIATPELKSSIIKKEDNRKSSYTNTNNSGGFTFILDEKPSIERAFSFKKDVPQSILKPVSIVDHQRVKSLSLRIITPNAMINRASKSFGPVYKF